MIVMGIEHDGEGVRLGVLIAARKLPRNPPGLAILHQNADIQRGVVIRDAKLGGFRCRFAFVRFSLRELGGRRRPHPRLVVQPAVHDDGRRGADGVDSRHGTVRRLLAGRDGGCAGDECQHRQAESDPTSDNDAPHPQPPL